MSYSRLCLIDHERLLSATYQDHERFTPSDLSSWNEFNLALVSHERRNIDIYFCVKVVMSFFLFVGLA